ncbi:hypothetical protein NDU88_002000, partial [Pleurodeles waltl]
CQFSICICVPSCIRIPLLTWLFPIPNELSHWQLKQSYFSMHLPSIAHTT